MNFSKVTTELYEEIMSLFSASTKNNIQINLSWSGDANDKYRSDYDKYFVRNMKYVIKQAQDLCSLNVIVEEIKDISEDNNQQNKLLLLSDNDVEKNQILNTINKNNERKSKLIQNARIRLSAIASIKVTDYDENNSLNSTQIETFKSNEDKGKSNVNSETKVNNTNSEFTKYQSGYIFPLAANTQYRISSHVGKRNSQRTTNGNRTSSNHKGMDIAVPIGTPVYSTYSGKVVAAGPANGFGKWVKIEQDDGNTAIYGHISSAKVSVGDTIRQGDLIALSGNEGNTTGPHLHYELRDSKGSVIDPENYYLKA